MLRCQMLDLFGLNLRVMWRDVLKAALLRLYPCSLVLKVSASPQLPNHIKTFCNGPKLQLGQPCCLQAPAVQHSIYNLLFLQIFSYSIQFKIVFSVLFHQSLQGDIARFRSISKRRWYSLTLLRKVPHLVDCVLALCVQSCICSRLLPQTALKTSFPCVT